MDEKQIPLRQALEDVQIMAERLAFLHYAFAKTLEKSLSKEQSEALIRESIEEYGRLAAESATQTILEKGLTPTLFSFKEGKDLPSIGWKFTPAENTSKHGAGKVSRVLECPLAKTWSKLGPEGTRLGRFYCNVDQAKYRHYLNGYDCFHDQNMLDGDDSCVIRVEANQSGQ